jgi:hypothetical protein
MFPEWQHKITRTKPYNGAEYGPGATITVKAGLHYFGGNSAPYFSVTGEITRPRRRDADTAGAIHEEILRHWPELAPVIDLHLSDHNGTPMYAEANGWYQLAGYYGGAGERYHAGNGDRQHWNADGSFDGYRHSTPDECLQSFAEHVRINVDAARQLADTWRQHMIPSYVRHEADILPIDRVPEDWHPVRAAFVAWLQAQGERFAAEARAAIAVLGTL